MGGSDSPSHAGRAQAGGRGGHLGTFFSQVKDATSKVPHLRHLHCTPGWPSLHVSSTCAVMTHGVRSRNISCAVLVSDYEGLVCLFVAVWVADNF